MKVKKITGEIHVEFYTDGRRTCTNIKASGNTGCQLLGSISILRQFENGMPRKIYAEASHLMLEDLCMRALEKMDADGFEEVEVADDFFKKPGED